MNKSSDYFARIQECMLLFLMNAAFFIQLTQKDETNAKVLLTAGQLSEKGAHTLFELLPDRDHSHLNPAFMKRTSCDSVKDLVSAKSDFLRLHRRILLLAAYAPDISTRKLLLHLSRDTRAILSLLDFIL